MFLLAPLCSFQGGGPLLEKQLLIRHSTDLLATVPYTDRNSERCRSPSSSLLLSAALHSEWPWKMTDTWANQLYVHVSASSSTPVARGLDRCGLAAPHAATRDDRPHELARESRPTRARQVPASRPHQSRTTATDCSQATTAQHCIEGQRLQCLPLQTTRGSETTVPAGAWRTCLPATVETSCMRCVRRKKYVRRSTYTYSTCFGPPFERDVNRSCNRLIMSV
jgi:hypothetical protein